MTFNEAYSVAKDEFPSRLAPLRRLSYGELAQLPAYVTSEACYGPHVATWTVYRDVLDDGQRVMIVVQLSIKRGKLLGLFWTGNVDAEGFTITQDGIVSTLRPEDLYEFT